MIPSVFHLDEQFLSIGSNNCCGCGLREWWLHAVYHILRSGEY